MKIIKEKRRVRPKNSEVLNLVSKNLLAKNVLGWKPEHNSKKKILKALLMTIEFYKNKRQVRTASLEQVRQPINKKSIGAWESYKSHLAEMMEVLEKNDA